MTFFAKALSNQQRQVSWLAPFLSSFPTASRWSVDMNDKNNRGAYSCATARDSHTIPYYFFT
jgi:hypothetical protein